MTEVHQRWTYVGGTGIKRAGSRGDTNAGEKIWWTGGGESGGFKEETTNQIGCSVRMIVNELVRRRKTGWNVS